MRHTCPSGANWLHAQISPCSTPPTTTARRRVRGLLSHRHHLALLLKTRPQDRRQHLRSSAASALVLLHLLMSNLERRQQQPPRSTPRASPMARTVTHQGLSIRPSIPPNLPSDTTACRSILALARGCQPTILTARARVLANRYLPGTLFTALTRTNTRPHTLLRAVANTTPSSPAPMLVRPTEITNLSTIFRSLGRRERARPPKFRNGRARSTWATVTTRIYTAATTTTTRTCSALTACPPMLHATMLARQLSIRTTRARAARTTRRTTMDLLMLSTMTTMTVARRLAPTATTNAACITLTLMRPRWISTIIVRPSMSSTRRYVIFRRPR